MAIGNQAAAFVDDDEVSSPTKNINTLDHGALLQCYNTMASGGRKDSSLRLRFRCILCTSITVRLNLP